jgi:metal-dependent amidase/aminoacylase/carboxypeptidase family protein
MKIITSLVLLIFFSLSAMAETYNLSVDKVTLDAGKFKRQAIGYNGATPGPTLRFKEGEDSENLHSVHYNFNDKLLPIGAHYWATLSETLLAKN